MYWVYVIENEQGKHYTGYTHDIQDRMLMHNGDSEVKKRFHLTTYRKGPWKIVFKKEFETKREALQFERFLKTGTGRDYVARARRGG